MATTSLKRMEFERWVDEYRPIKNRLTRGTAISGFVFLKHGRDLERVLSHPHDKVWSFIIDDEGRESVWLVADGMHVVNVHGFLLTRRPFNTDAFYEILY